MVDDILVLVHGDDMKQVFGKALDATHQYLIDMGATVAPDKSIVFATTKSMRKWLNKHIWPVIGKTVKVVQQFIHGRTNISDTGATN